MYLCVCVCTRSLVVFFLAGALLLLLLHCLFGLGKEPLLGSATWRPNAQQSHQYCLFATVLFAVAVAAFVVVAPFAPSLLLLFGSYCSCFPSTNFHTAFACTNCVLFSRSRCCRCRCRCSCCCCFRLSRFYCVALCVDLCALYVRVCVCVWSYVWASASLTSLE